MLDLCLVELPNPALESPKMYMPLGNLYLYAVAKKAGYKVEIADFRDGLGGLPEAKFYGFSATTPHIKWAGILADKVKGKTIIGGAHASLRPEDCLDRFDYIVRGEGEEALLSILSGKVESGIITASRIKDLDSIPFPAWDAVDEPFSKTLYTGERYGEGDVSMAMIASRGCPFNCSFCGNMLKKPVTFRSVENICMEIQLLKLRRVHHFRFVDDNFTVHPKLYELCLAFKPLNIRYRAHTRSDLITENKAKWLAESGCEECSLGVEVADDHVLKLNNKRETVEQHKEASQIIKAAGMKLKVYMMSGLPGETDETIRKNIEFIKTIKPDKWTLSTFTPYPGCDIFEHPEKYKIKIADFSYEHYWNFVFNVRDLKLPYRKGYVHVLNGQSPEDMKERHDRFYNFLIKEDWR